MVQDLLIESQRPRSHPVHVVGVVRSPQTVKVANYMVKDLGQGTMTAELLQPDELVSGLMAQVTLHLVDRHAIMYAQILRWNSLALVGLRLLLPCVDCGAGCCAVRHML